MVCMELMELIDKLIEYINNAGPFGVVLSCGLMSIESIFPIIPLVALITINEMLLGKLLGFFVSWFFTVAGCVMSYYIFKKGFGNKFERLTQDKEKIDKYRKALKNIKFSTLVLIIAMPLTPAFIVNIVAGLVKMDFKKYFVALLIGKLSMVYFLGFMGTSFIAGLKDPSTLIRIVIIMIIVYGSCYIINKILKLN